MKRTQLDVEKKHKRHSHDRSSSLGSASSSSNIINNIDTPQKSIMSRRHHRDNNSAFVGAEKTRKLLGNNGIHIANSPVKQFGRGCRVSKRPLTYEENSNRRVTKTVIKAAANVSCRSF
eukprot:Tbor_TRINITY_DN6260_c0_g1::TRINITY_DN6260_c0_g1_i1::g.2053::m.2053